MRISDWSSDVCSSDLESPLRLASANFISASSVPSRWTWNSALGSPAMKRAMAALSAGGVAARAQTGSVQASGAAIAARTSILLSSIWDPHGGRESRASGLSGPTIPPPPGGVHRRKFHAVFQKLQQVVRLAAVCTYFRVAGCAL